MVVVLKLLGDFQAADSRGQPLQVNSSKGRLLLACLALHQDTGCARETLAELFWEDRRPEQAQLSLRQELARLRSALKIPEVSKWNDKHLLRLPSEVSADVASFLAAVAVGDCKAAALSYGGDLLTHVAVKTPKLSDWLALKRNELRNYALSSCVSVLFRATDQELDVSVDKIAILAVQLDPFCELAHQWLIRVHASHGNTVLAMEQFRVLNEALYRDGGRQPSEQTVSVLRAMLGRPQQGAAPPPHARATVDWINEINRQHGMAAAPV